MTTKILIAFLGLTLITACSKDNFATKPTLKLKSINTNTLAKGDFLQVILEVTDAEGDLQDSIWIQQVVRNCSASGFISKYKFPDFPQTKNLKGDINICFAYGTNLGCPTITGPKCTSQNDSSVFKIWIQDKAKNISDTITTDEVVVLQ